MIHFPNLFGPDYSGLDDRGPNEQGNTVCKLLSHYKKYLRCHKGCIASATGVQWAERQTEA